MSAEPYRYEFTAGVPPEEVEATLLLSVFAAESLYGESQVRLEAAHAFDADRRVCVLSADTAVGRDLNRLFVGFLAREFGPDAFRVCRASAPARPAPEPAARPHSTT